MSVANLTLDGIDYEVKKNTEGDFNVVTVRTKKPVVDTEEAPKKEAPKEENILEEVPKEVPKEEETEGGRRIRTAKKNQQEGGKRRAKKQKTLRKMSKKELIKMVKSMK